MTRVVLLRHGESVWNRAGRFTGWTDVDLSHEGEAQAARAGKRLIDCGFDFDIGFTSVLKRAIRSLHLALEAMDRLWLPVEKSWRLNERHYGALQGMLKAAAAEQYGIERLRQWRRGLMARPPALAVKARSAGHDRRYADLGDRAMPVGESLADTVARVAPYWDDRIAPAIRQGRRVIVAAHGNSLRALLKYLGNLDARAVEQLEIRTAIPLIIELDDALRPSDRRYLE